MIRLKSILGILLVLLMGSAPAVLAQESSQKPSAQQGQPAPSGQQAQPADEFPEEDEAVTEGPAVKFGLKAGLNFANLRSTNPATQRMVPVGGLFIGVQGDGHVGFGLEFLYTMKGYKTPERTIDLDYIQMPVLVSYTLPKIGKVAPYLSTGPAGAMRVRAMWGTAKQSTQDAFVDKLRRLELSWTASAGLEIPMLGGAISLEARYDYGLTSIFTGTSTYGNKNDKLKTTTLFIGYRF